MEVDLVNWSAPSPASSIFISISSDKLPLGKNVTVSGFTYPAHPNSKVTLIYTMPNGTILTRNVTTRALGEFEDTTTPNIAGNWSVKAVWSGDHERAESSALEFKVESLWEPYVIAVTVVTTIIVIAIFVGIVTICKKRRTHTSRSTLARVPMTSAFHVLQINGPRFYLS
jgi:hypothetical protein